MFATLLGAMPAPDHASPADAAPEWSGDPRPARSGDPRPARSGDASRLAIWVAAQAEAGLEPVTDGAGAATLTPGPDRIVERWRGAAALTDRAVKAVLEGPWSASISAAAPRGRERERDVLSRAEWTREVVEALAAAGCPLIEIEESQAHVIGDDPVARRLFRTAHLAVARDVARTHLSLSIIGGSAWEAGPATILDPPYPSLAVDLIAGPENWRLVAAAPRERGIVVGVIEPEAGSDDGPELPVWAAHYAASTAGRGLERVGIGTAGSLAGLPWSIAVGKLRALGEAARVAGLPPGELADGLDPRAVSIRSAALGRAARRPPAPCRRPAPRGR